MSNAASIRVLYVEDDVSTAETFTMLVTQGEKKTDRRVSIEWVASLADGLAHAKKIPPPDLIILDLSLPDSTDALTTAARIKDFHDFGSEVVVLSGNPSQRVRQAVESMGVAFHEKTSGFTSLLEKGVSWLFDVFAESKKVRAQREQLAITSQRIAGVQAHTHGSPD